MGSALPLSTREIDDCVVPHLRASSRWEMPSASRASAIASGKNRSGVIAVGSRLEAGAARGGRRQARHRGLEHLLAKRAEVLLMEALTPQERPEVSFAETR